MTKQQQNKIRTVVAIPADPHAGSVVGLIPPQPWNLVEGGVYYPSFGQKILWKQWEGCWKRVGVLRENARLVIVGNGDLVDGDHHHTTQLVSPRQDEQERIFVECMEYALKLANFQTGDRQYYIRGTEIHTGGGGASEENIARQLGAEPYTKGKGKNDGTYLWPQLIVDINGVLLDIAHHGPSAGWRAWTKGNIVKFSVKSLYFDYLDAGERIPRYFISSHYHEFVHEIFEGKKATIEAFITPSFQWKTHYGMRVARTKLSDIGMLIIVIEEDGTSHWECPRITYSPNKQIERI